MVLGLKSTQTLSSQDNDEVIIMKCSIGWSPKSARILRDLGDWTKHSACALLLGLARVFKRCCLADSQQMFLLIVCTAAFCGTAAPVLFYSIC